MQAATKRAKSIDVTFNVSLGQVIERDCELLKAFAMYFIGVSACRCSLLPALAVARVLLGTEKLQELLLQSSVYHYQTTVRTFALAFWLQFCRSRIAETQFWRELPCRDVLSIYILLPTQGHWHSSQASNRHAARAMWRQTADDVLPANHADPVSTQGVSPHPFVNGIGSLTIFQSFTGRAKHCPSRTAAFSSPQVFRGPEALGSGKPQCST